MSLRYEVSSIYIFCGGWDGVGHGGGGGDQNLSYGDHFTIKGCPMVNY